MLDEITVLGPSTIYRTDVVISGTQHAALPYCAEEAGPHIGRQAWRLTFWRRQTTELPMPMFHLWVTSHTSYLQGAPGSEAHADHGNANTATSVQWLLLITLAERLDD